MTTGYLCFRHLPCALSYVTHVCNIHNICTYVKQHTHTMFPQLLWVHLFLSLWPMSLLSLWRKPEFVSGYTPTSATFDAHLPLFLLFLLLSHTHTHAHILILSQRVVGNMLRSFGQVKAAMVINTPLFYFSGKSFHKIVELGFGDLLPFSHKSISEVSHWCCDTVWLAICAEGVGWG